jgi:hypothetical protein
MENIDAGIDDIDELTSPGEADVIQYSWDEITPIGKCAEKIARLKICGIIFVCGNKIWVSVDGFDMLVVVKI